MTRAETRDESQRRLQRDVEELRRLRDELSLQLQPGRMEVRGLWDELEERWSELEASAAGLTAASGQAARQLGAEVQAGIASLQRGYERVAAKLDQPYYTLWDRCRNTFDLLVEGSFRATGRVVDTFEELGDAAQLRVTKARLDRTSAAPSSAAGSTSWSSRPGSPRRARRGCSSTSGSGPCCRKSAPSTGSAARPRPSWPRVASC